MPARTAYGPRRVLPVCTTSTSIPSFLRPIPAKLTNIGLVTCLRRCQCASTLPTPGDRVAGASRVNVGGNGAGDGGKSPASGSGHRAADVFSSYRPLGAANDKTTRLPPAPAACGHSCASWTCPRGRCTASASTSRAGPPLPQTSAHAQRSV
ncbi:hypothetical protein C8R46DRAFT_1227998 [Mycena filopes]|nr:hypothetical protein C8R46DRAFT_1227998 [Mycena filopes]